MLYTTFLSAGVTEMTQKSECIATHNLKKKIQSFSADRAGHSLSPELIPPQNESGDPRHGVALVTSPGEYTGLCRVRGAHAHRGVVDAGDLVEIFLGDHERGQVCRVAGREEDGEQRPDVGDDPAGDTSRRVHVDRSAEQYRPDEPKRPEQRKLVL